MSEPNRLRSNPRHKLVISITYHCYRESDARKHLIIAEIGLRLRLRQTLFVWSNELYFNLKGYVKKTGKGEALMNRKYFISLTRIKKYSLNKVEHLIINLVPRVSVLI